MRRAAAAHARSPSCRRSRPTRAPAVELVQPGFLRLERVDWNSPAQLLEQIIRHEAVHQIDGWDDLRRRLQPDRRCFAFFHPQLPAEPLIFVEVALLPAMPAAIAPLIDKASELLPASQFRWRRSTRSATASPGWGVSLGNFLIKRVADELKRELPQLKTFCIARPSRLRARWVKAARAARACRTPRAARAGRPAACARRLRRRWTMLAQTATLRAGPNPPARRCCGWPWPTSAECATAPDGDPVARFHLDNGARLEWLDPLGDLSEKGAASPGA